MTFSVDQIAFIDFESKALVDLKAVGHLSVRRRSVDQRNRAGLCDRRRTGSYWHADGAILDWNDAPDDLRDAFDRGMMFAAWNASFDSAVWNFATLGFPLPRARARHRSDDSSRRLQLADRP